MFKKIFVHSPVRYIVGVVLAVIITLICLVSKGFEYKISYVDAFTVAGGILFFLGLLQLASYCGAFEIFGYSFSSFRGRVRKYKDYYEYQMANAEKRAKQKPFYVPFMVVGLIFFVIGLVLYAILL